MKEMSQYSFDLFKFLVDYPETHCLPPFSTLKLSYGNCLFACTDHDLLISLDLRNLLTQSGIPGKANAGLLIAAES